MIKKIKRQVWVRKTSALFAGVFFMLTSAYAFSVSISGNIPTEPLFNNSDFECGDLQNWTASGNAFLVQPTKGDNSALRNRPAGPQGTYWIGTFERYNGIIGNPGDLQADTKTGTLTSIDFPISKNYINFMIGGGLKPGLCTVEIWVDGQLFSSDTGADAETLALSSVDVRSCIGKTARIIIRDEVTTGWGHINADWFTASDAPLQTSFRFKKELQVNKKYLLVPVKSDTASTKTGQIFQLLKNGKLLREFRVVMPENGAPASWTAFYPVDMFAGETVTVESKTRIPTKYLEAANAIALSDEIPENASDYSLPYRDQFHFSQRRGWNNDMNGLVYNSGVYHLYYQYNPFNIGWDNMHWGHASSTDLVHWVEQDIALYQNGMGDMMFSGGGFMDVQNTSGVSSNGIIPQFAAFTSTGRGECLAYSLNGGTTFTEIPENPVVKHTGRDPKVIWHQPTQKWIMAVYDKTSTVLDPQPLPGTAAAYSNNSVAFYSSTNLRAWKFESRFIHPDRVAIHECPELFEIPVEGRPEETRYILYGVENRYFIGWFDGTNFTAEAGPFAGETGKARAAQIFSDAPGNRKIQMAWVMSGIYLQRWPNQRYSQGCLIPKEVTLRETPDGLRLFFYPVTEINKLRGEQLVAQDNLTVGDADQIFKTCSGKLLDVIMEYELEAGAKITLTLNGQIVSSNGSGSMRVLSDRTITEAFINNGQQAISFRRPESTFDATASGITMTGSGTITSLTIYEMKSIWP